MQIKKETKLFQTITIRPAVEVLAVRKMPENNFRQVVTFLRPVPPNLANNEIQS